ncbi:MAG: C-GCAxxG-C-C family protein [Pelosinus sp.]|nr:C-GCAxxG-C-C family protein [Pelosinus sp.]
MSKEIARIAELHMQGFHCSQILVILGLERQGKKNPDLVRAMAGLAGGLGFSGGICGVLTGAVCLLGLFAGRGEVEEQENRILNNMIQELIRWFEEKFAGKYGGTLCQNIIKDDPWNRMLSCPELVTETYGKVMELLAENDFIVPDATENEEQF